MVLSAKVIGFYNYKYSDVFLQVYIIILANWR